MNPNIHNTEWRLWTPPSSDTPAHIYAGVRLVATVFDYDAAHWMVAEHNSRLLIERGRAEREDIAVIGIDVARSMITRPRQPISSGEMAIIRSIVHVIGTHWGASPAIITSGRAAALDAIADGLSPADAIHRALDVLSGIPR